ncbi:MAG: TIGR04326 family surface carbohydrate biosynthesis protein [Elusimicrobiota bacterium]
MTAPLLVWDRDGEPSGSDGAALLWRSCARVDGSSVPLYLEKNAERLRSRYLEFIHDLGESRVGGKSLIEHLALEDGFSYWWMTQLAEKSPFKSPGIYTSLRLLALEEMLRERRPPRLSLVSSDLVLAESVRALCRNLGIDFEFRSAGAPARNRSLRGIYRDLPFPLQGFIAFARYLVERRFFRRAQRPLWFSGDGAVFVCSFFAHLDLPSCARGDFHSRQWEMLPKRLHDEGRRINWVHHFIPGPGAPDARTCLSWLTRFNAQADAQGAHAFLDSYRSWGVVARSFASWARLNAAVLRLGDVQGLFTPRESAVWLWPSLRDDWRTSLTGTVAAGNCLWVELFDAALADLPRQRKGLYLCENQGWERALLRAWRKHGHGEITGVAHATVPFWHLYYFDDPRVRRSTGPLSLPQPDRLAVNGPAAWKLSVDGGYPIERLVEVEALRYLKLSRTRPAPRHESAPMKVLILGDALPASMRNLMTILSQAVRRLPADWRFTFKPHPILPVDLTEYSGLEKVGSTTEALDRILGEFDLALAANSTSAAVDAYQAGLPVAIGLDGSDLNLSPLRGQPGARFVATADELVEAFQAAGSPAAKAGREEFFFLDPELPRWKRLLL